MFKITLLPQAGGEDTSISVDGSRIVYNSVSYDFSTILVGEQVEGLAPAVGLIKNVGGVIELSLLYTYDVTKAEATQLAEGEDLVFEVSEGESS